MSATSSCLASGPGWAADDVVCTSGPQDRSFEEQHGSVCIALVTSGTFQYRSAEGSALLAPGSLLLGTPGRCFECGHEHGTGDRCLSFHYEPAFFDALLAEVPGVRRSDFGAVYLPAMPELASVLAEAEAARDEDNAPALEETALRLAAAVVTTLAGGRRYGRTPSRRDEQRIGEALRRLEGNTAEPLTLANLASGAAMSPYHFLRVFRQVVGLTPHQFVLRTRLHRAAVRLRVSDDPVSTIALDSGFNDLSTFNRRFRQVLGVSPTVYRQRG